MGSPQLNPCESTLIRVVRKDHARGSAPLAIAMIGCSTDEAPTAADSLSCVDFQFIARAVYACSGKCQRARSALLVLPVGPETPCG